jgi:hypothetical protein
MRTALQTTFVQSEDQWLRKVGPADRDEVPFVDLRRVVDEDVGKLVYPVISQF